MPCCRVGMTALAAKFEEVDSAAPFIVALVVVMGVTALKEDVAEWWTAQKPSAKPAIEQKLVRGERLRDPIRESAQRYEE